MCSSDLSTVVTWLYTLVIASLMVSQLPVLSGKRVGKRVPPEMVLPLFVMVILFFALLIAYPWWVLSIGTLCYLGCLPLGWYLYRQYQRKHEASAPPPASAELPGMDAPPVTPPDNSERPARLN